MRKMRFEVHRALGDGSCLFDAVRQIVAPSLSVDRMRQLVASTVLDPHNVRANDAIATWVTLYASCLAADRDGDDDDDGDDGDDDGDDGGGDGATYYDAANVRHVACLFRGGRPPRLPLGREARQQLYDAMMHTDYWGDEYAIDVLERTFDIVLIVVRVGPTEDVQRVHLPARLGNTDRVGLVRYTSTPPHYEPISVDGRFLWRFDEYVEYVLGH